MTAACTARGDGRLARIQQFAPPAHGRCGASVVAALAVTNRMESATTAAGQGRTYLPTPQSPICPNFGVLDRMFKRILIARGETARCMGIESVAVYSDGYDSAGTVFRRWAG